MSTNVLPSSIKVVNPGPTCCHICFTDGSFVLFGSLLLSQVNRSDVQWRWPLSTVTHREMRLFLSTDKSVETLFILA